MTEPERLSKAEADNNSMNLIPYIPLKIEAKAEEDILQKQNFRFGSSQYELNHTLLVLFTLFHFISSLPCAEDDLS